MQRDARGLEYSTDSAEAVGKLDRAVEHFLKYHNDTMALLDQALAADPDFVMGHCMKGYLLLNGMNRAQRPAIGASLAAAQKGAPSATRREQRHVAAFAASARGAFGEAFGAWDALLADDPTDLLALRISGVTCFRHGRNAEIMAQAQAVAPAWSAALPGYECFESVWAFAHEEAGDAREAERAIDSATARDPENLFAHHVKAHVLNADCRAREGADWMAGQARHWAKGNNMMHHLWWHRALLVLELGEHDAVLASYDQNIRNLNGTLTRAAPAQYNDIQNASALLWRLENQGVDVGARWEELGEKAEARLEEPYQPLLPPHLMMAMVATGRDAAASRYLEILRANAADPDLWEAAAYGDVIVAACEAARAHRRGEHAAVVARLAPRLGVLERLGGSYAQRDLLRQMLVSSAMRVGRRDVVRAMLAEEAGFYPVPPARRSGYAAAARWV